MRTWVVALVLLVSACSNQPASEGEPAAAVAVSETSIEAAELSAAEWEAATRTAEQLTPAELSLTLKDLGYSPAEIAAVTRAPQPASRRSDDQLWRTANHIYGFIALNGGPPAALPVTNAFDVAADPQLVNQPLRITLDRLRIRKYPGKGTHNIAFFCHAQTQVGTELVPVDYSVAHSAREGDEVAAVGVTIFLGIRASSEGVGLKCGTLNVDTNKDKTFFNVLADNAFTQGLRLLDTAQPALLPLTALTRSVKKELEDSKKGVPVQKFELGLDFSAVSTRIKLAPGSYLIIQIPPEDVAAWNWSDWEYSGGRVQRKADRTQLIPYNYTVFSVSRMS